MSDTLSLSAYSLFSSLNRGGTPSQMHTHTYASTHQMSNKSSHTKQQECALYRMYSLPPPPIHKRVRTRCGNRGAPFLRRGTMYASSRGLRSAAGVMSSAAVAARLQRGCCERIASHAARRSAVGALWIHTHTHMHTVGASIQTKNKQRTNKEQTKNKQRTNKEDGEASVCELAFRVHMRCSEKECTNDTALTPQSGRLPRRALRGRAGARGSLPSARGTALLPPPSARGTVQHTLVSVSVCDCVCVCVSVCVCVCVCLSVCLSVCAILLEKRYYHRC